MGGREEGEYTSERAGGVELAAAAAVRRLHGSNDSNDYELVTSPRCEIVNSDVRHGKNSHKFVLQWEPLIN